MPHDPKFKLTRITRYGVNIGGTHAMFDPFMAGTFDNDDYWPAISWLLFV